MTAQKSSYGAAAARLLALRDGFASGAVRFTIIPTNVRGRIYRLKSATGPYVWDTTETGGPSNGVRFVLYKDSAFAVVTPLDSIGYVDLLDESSGSTNTLEVKITVGSTTYADYTISGSEGSSIDNLTLSGYVTDTKTMVNFTMTFNDNSTTGALTMNSTISAPAISFNYVFKLSVSSMTSGSTTTTTITLNYTVSDATDSLTAQGTLTEVESNSGTTESGTITVSANGVTFATITASASGETYSANTGSLSTSQQQALSSLFASGLELQVFVVFLIIPFGIV
ncbi:MAG TPA: hypothetical protein VN848_06735 [Gemmatimonadales bacterium]|nr:hypothetical protein [Gemmatimonadales bacterium]